MGGAAAAAAAAAVNVGVAVGRPCSAAGCTMMAPVGGLMPQTRAHTYPKRGAAPSPCAAALAAAGG